MLRLCPRRCPYVLQLRRHPHMFLVAIRMFFVVTCTEYITRIPRSSAITQSCTSLPKILCVLGFRAEDFQLTDPRVGPDFYSRAIL